MKIWLAAHYHLPSTYSCRTPMSSQSAVLALPTPGPATVRLSLIRASIELHGETITRDSVFSMVCAMPVRIHPPGSVAMSVQNVRHYKANEHPDRGIVFEESLGYREYSVAHGDLVVFAEIPESALELLGSTRLNVKKRCYVIAFQSAQRRLG